MERQVCGSDDEQDFIIPRIGDRANIEKTLIPKLVEWYFNNIQTSFMTILFGKLRHAKIDGESSFLDIEKIKLKLKK